LSMSKERKAAVYRSGWRWQEASSRPPDPDRRRDGCNGSGLARDESVLLRSAFLAFCSDLGMHWERRGCLSTITCSRWDCTAITRRSGKGILVALFGFLEPWV
jgi:hypothetical protein